MARRKIKHRTYNLRKPKQTENTSREAERVLIEYDEKSEPWVGLRLRRLGIHPQAPSLDKPLDAIYMLASVLRIGKADMDFEDASEPAQDATTQQPDFTETEHEDLPNAFLKPAQDATTKQPDVTETEHEDLPSVFSDSQTFKGPGDTSHSRVEDVSDSGNTCTMPKPEERRLDRPPKPQENRLNRPPKPQENRLVRRPKPQEKRLVRRPKPQENRFDRHPKPQENIFDRPPKTQENELDLGPKPQENESERSPKPHENDLDLHPNSQENCLDLSPISQDTDLDLSPEPQENGLDLRPNPQENGLDLSSKLQVNELDMSPQEHVLDMSLKRQERSFDMTPGLLEPGLYMNDDSLESVSVSPILDRQESSRTSFNQYQPRSRLVDNDPLYSCDSPLNLAWDSKLKETYQSEARNPGFRPITPDHLRIPVDEILSPTTQKEIRTTIRALFPNGPPPPPPVRPVRKPKKGDLPYIVGCTKRPRVPSPKSLTVFRGDPYGITDNSNCQEDEDQCSSAKRGRRGPNGSASLSKSRFNPQSNEIAKKLKFYEKIDRLLGRTPKAVLNYMSKPRSFSPLPSTSTDNETIMKNDKHFSESLNCDNDNYDIDDDEELPEIFWDTGSHKQEKERTDSPLAIIKKINEDKKSDTENILTEINDDMSNNNNGDVSMDEIFCKIDFDKYLPKEKLLYCPDEQDVKPNLEPQVNNTIDLDNRYPPVPVPFLLTSDDVICVDDVYNQGNNNNGNTSTSNLNLVSQAPANTATSVLRASNKIATSTATRPLDLVIEVPDVSEPMHMPCQASTSRAVWSNDVEFVSEVRTRYRLPRGENIETISDVQIISQGPSGSHNTIMALSDRSFEFLHDLVMRETRSQARKKSKRQRKENQDVPAVNNENTAPSVNQAQSDNSASQPMSPEKRLGECPICLDILPQGSIASTNCGHVFCLECIKQSLKNTGRRCPTCRKLLRGVGYHQVFL